MSKLQAAINALRGPVLIVDPDDRISYCNSQMRAEYALVADRMTQGAFVQDLLTAIADARYFAVDGDPADFLAQRLRQIRDREAVSYEVQPVANRWLRMEQTPTEDGGLVVIGYNVTDIRQTSRRLSAIIDSLQSGLIYADRAGRVLLTNSTARSYYPAFASELVNAPTGHEHRLPDGRWILKSRQETADAGVVTLISDLTEMKLAEHRVQDTFDRLDIELSRFDSEHRLILCNAAFRARFPGLEHLCVPGVNFRHLFETAEAAGIFQEDGAGGQDWREAALLPHLKRKPFTLERGSNDSGWRQVNLIPTSDGGSILTAYDVTTRKRAEAEVQALNLTLERRVEERTAALSDALSDLKEAQARLVQQEKLAALGSLVAGIAHEINTPLGVAVTASSFLEEAAASLDAVLAPVAEAEGAIGASKATQAREWRALMTQAVGLIVANLQRATKLIDSLKQVSVDQISEARRSIDVPHYLAQVAETLEPLLRQSGHRFRIEGDAGLVAETYPGVIAQILSNLVINALHHGLAGRLGEEIRIECRRLSPERFRIAVSDRGAGVEPILRQRIFEPFFTTRRREGGMGLGLHIVENLVVLGLSGEIRVDCEHEPGLRIEIDMPTIAPAPGLNPAPSEPSLGEAVDEQRRPSTVP